MYRTIDAAFWTDPKVKALPANGRLLFLYFITNPHTHVSGIYYLPRNVMAHETGLQEKAVDTLCDTLSSAGFCGFDRVLELVWVKNMMRYQGRGEKNRRSAAHHVTEDLHNSPLAGEFLTAYPEVRALVSDTVWDRVSSSGTPDSRFLNPESRNLNTEQDQEQDLPSLKIAKERPRDEAADMFSECCLNTTCVPYTITTADMVQLSGLRKAFGIGKTTPPDWKTACLNYFGSPLPKWTLADLSVRYSVFRNSSLDRFKTPINHTGANGNGNQRETDHEKNQRAARDFMARSVASEMRGDVPDVRENSVGFPRKV